MAREGKPLRVFVDTSYLTRMPSEERADWERLLLLSRQGDAEIHVSQIAIEEYRTQQRDELLTAIERTRKAVNDLHRRWRGSPISSDLEQLIETDIFPQDDAIETLSITFRDRLVSTNNIRVQLPAPSHADRVWKKYFSWIEIFGRVPLIDRGDRKTRDNRRKNLPDAWIYEAAVDLADSGERVVCLCKDENLSACLRDATIDVVERTNAVLDAIEATDRQGAPQEEAEKSGETTVIAGGAGAELKEALDKIDNADRELHVRILGYVQWLDGVSKSDLIELLVARSHSSAAIELAIQRLKLNNLIEEVGKQLFSANDGIGEQAKTAVMPELLESLAP